MIKDKKYTLNKEQYELIHGLLHENIKLRNMLKIVEKELANTIDSGGFSLS